MNPRTTLEGFEAELRRTRRVSEAAMQQLDDAGLHTRINPQQNSIAVIIQHMHGNMLSQWTGFLASDGEKPGRDRDSEFTDRELPRAELMALWDEGWRCVFDALAPLTDADLARVVTIRNEPLTVAAAIARQLAHYNWHAGQIALIAKHLVGDRWNYLTIPPGGTKAFNQKMGL